MRDSIRLPFFSLLATAATLLAVAEPTSKPSMHSHSGEEMAKTTLAPTAKEIKPVKVGDPLPELPPLKNAEGAQVDLAKSIEGKTAVIVFYRGGWCPFCTKHLAEVASIQPQLAEAGVELIAISPDAPEKLAATSEKHALSYTLLSDGDHKVMKAMGIAFTVDPVTKEKYKGYGIQLQGTSGELDAALPVPSVFVVNESGEIAYAHSDPDYTKRLDGPGILKAAGVE